MKGVFKMEQKSGCQSDSSWAHCWKHSGVYSYLCLFFLSSINNGSATNFGNLPPLPVKRPAADLVSNHIFYKEHSPIKPQGQLIE